MVVKNSDLPWYKVTNHPQKTNPSQQYEQENQNYSPKMLVNHIWDESHGFNP